MTEAEIDLMKRQIEIQIRERAEAIAAAAAWYREWKAGRGFRCVEQNKQQGA